MNLEQIEKLNELRERGLITDEEFQRGKTEALGGGRQPSASPRPRAEEVRSYAMILHLTQFTSFVVPFFGWVVPLILWMVRRDDPYIDNHGKVVFNWVISSFIYFLLCLVLILAVVGIFLMVGLFICSIVFTVMGAINASNGVTRNYPMAIPFFNVDTSVDAQ